MTAPVRSKDMRGHALRTELSFRPPISGEWRDADLSGCDGAIFSFRIRVTEHCLDSLHTTLNCLSRIARAIFWTTIVDLVRLIFRERRAGKKVTNAAESLVGLHGRVRSCTLRNVASADISHLQTL